MSDEDGYNGWTNHSTWLAHLWLTGDNEATYKHARLVAREASSDAAAIRALTYTLREDTRAIGDGLNLPEVCWPEVLEALREE